MECGENADREMEMKRDENGGDGGMENVEETIYMCVKQI